MDMIRSSLRLRWWVWRGRGVGSRSDTRLRIAFQSPILEQLWPGEADESHCEQRAEAAADHRDGGTECRVRSAFEQVRDQPGPAKLLEVLRGVGDAEARTLREILDAALALREVLEQLQPAGAAQAPSHERELLEQSVLGTGH